LNLNCGCCRASYQAVSAIDYWGSYPFGVGASREKAGQIHLSSNGSSWRQNLTLGFDCIRVVNCDRSNPPISYRCVVVFWSWP